MSQDLLEPVRRFLADRQSFPYKQKTVILSGPQELSYAQIVNILSKIAGKPIKIKVIANEEWATIPQIKDNLNYGNVDYGLAMTSSFEAVRQGEAAIVSPLLQDLLGRELETFEATVSGMAQAPCGGHKFWGK